MKVLVDTDVWSEAFRKAGEENSEEVLRLRDLIIDGRVQMIGLIRMEVLSGIRDLNRFEAFSEKLSVFPDRNLDTEIFITAAKLLNLCRKNGIQGSMTDFIICACSILWECPILTKDNDYKHYSKFVPIELF